MNFVITYVYGIYAVNKGPSEDTIENNGDNNIFLLMNEFDFFN